MSGRDPFLRALALLALLQFALLSSRLVYPDLNLDYPFVDGDSHDWIANGLRLAGYDVRWSGRSPLLPLAIALLERAGALSWLPVLLQALFHLTVLAFYTLAARLASRAAAFAASLALLVNHSLVGISLQVMADVPASCLLFLAARWFLLGRYAAAGLAGGLSAVTQPLGVLLAVPAALTLTLRRRADLGARTVWWGAGLLAGLPVLARLFSGDPLVRHWTLLAPHASSIPFYSSALLTFLGLPGCLLLAAGLGTAVRDAWRGGDAPLFVTALFAVLTGFFVFLYTYEAGRFLVHPLWMAGLLIAWALARMPRVARGVAAVLLVAGSALPRSGEPNWHRRVGAEWRSRTPEARLDPDLFRADRSALYLYEKPSDGGGRYTVITRLGNALRKRVKYVPRSWMEPWWGWMDLTPLGRIGEDHVYRVRLAGSAQSWVLAAPRPLTPVPSPAPPPPSPGEGRPLAILSHLRGWDGYVALVPGGGPPRPWQLYLPFLVETTELYVAEPGQEAEILRIFQEAPNLGELRIGPVTVRRSELLGRKASLVRGTAAPPR